MLAEDLLDARIEAPYRYARFTGGDMSEVSSRPAMLAAPLLEAALAPLEVLGALGALGALKPINNKHN